MYSRQRVTPYGNSLWEFEVYGDSNVSCGGGAPGPMCGNGAKASSTVNAVQASNSASTVV